MQAHRFVALGTPAHVAPPYAPAGFFIRSMGDLDQVAEHPVARAAGYAAFLRSEAPRLSCA